MHTGSGSGSPAASNPSSPTTLRKRLYSNVEPFSYPVIFVWDLGAGAGIPAALNSSSPPTVESLLLSQAFVVLASWTKTSVRSSSLYLLSKVLIFLPQPTSLTGYADALAFVSDERFLRLSKRSC